MERGRLQSALTRAFPEPDELAMLMSLSLDTSLASLVSLKQSYDLLVFHLVQATEARGWTADLIVAACASRPGNSDLAAVAEPLGLAPGVPRALEVMISEHSGMHDVAGWRAELWRTEARVCRLEAPYMAGGAAIATAFLVGSDLAMTNYHAIAHLADGRGNAADAKLRFDFKRDSEGALINAGVTYGLAEDWLVAASPPSMSDAAGTAASPAAAALDFAILRLREPVGETTVGGVKDAAGDAVRGWVEIDHDPPALTEGLPILIVQHPDGAPLKFAMDVVLRLNDDNTRVLYRTNTSGGSSGSPCFDLHWRLRALHQAGNDSQGVEPYNQGVPMRAIAAQLDVLGLLEPPPIPEAEQS